MNKHLAELLQSLRPSDLFREKRKLNYMEEFVVEFVGLVEILLLHSVSYAAVLAVGVWQIR